MPCTYTGSIDGDRIMGLEEALDRATARACAAFTVLEEVGLLRRVSKEHREWWKNHKAADARRQKKEK